MGLKYRKMSRVDNYYRFIFVGRYDGVPAYYAQVRALIAEYRMLPDRFWFTGAVPDEDLAAFYRWADAYVSLSEHEGFCVPIAQAMAFDVPVLAFAAAAVPETMGGSGLLIHEWDTARVGELMHLAISDQRLRERIVAGQRANLRRFSAEETHKKLRAVVASRLNSVQRSGVVARRRQPVIFQPVSRPVSAVRPL